MIDSALSSISEAKKAPKWKVILILSAGVLTIIGLLYLWVALRRKDRELAEYKHKEDLRREKALLAEELSKVTEDIKKKEELINEALFHQAAADAIGREAAKIQDERKEIHDKIDALRTWGDVDRFLNR